MEQILSPTLSRPSVDDSDYVIIEQKPWGKDVGRTSMMQGIIGIKAAIYGTAMPDANCGGEDGFDTPVYVYPSRPDLNFSFNICHGQFVPCVVSTIVLEEIVQCGLQDSVELDYPPSGEVNLAWLGDCFDKSGNVIASPEIDITGRTVSFGQKVYGSLRARYPVYRKTYNCRIEEREDSLENNFQSVVYAVWKGGVKWKEIDPPSGYEEYKGNCGNGTYDGEGGGGEICSPQGSRYPKAVRADRHTKTDYCSQQIQSDSVTESVDYDNDNTPCDDSDTPITTN